MHLQAGLYQVQVEEPGGIYSALTQFFETIATYYFQLIKLTVLLHGF